MWVLKPNWITHGRSRNLELGILSVDIDSNSKRFLTSCFDGSICIWSLACVLTDEDVDVQLAKVSQHEGPVNCVRWSPNSQSFASASDDSFVLVWELSDINTSESKEHWRAVMSLRAHTSDVKEVAWSPDGKVLVSGGIDNVIFVWDIMHRISTPIAVLKDHTGFINGLTFDPLNQYLASLGDDNRLIIWDTHSWTAVSETVKVFEPNRYQQIRRICFTPDGTQLVHAGPKRSNYKFTATVTGRDDWTPGRYLVGHCKAVSVVKACPVMFKGNEKPAWVVAVGGYDCALSIWKSDDEPIAIRDLFDSAVADISWTSDGSTLIACSSDGTVAVLHFKEGDLGEPLSQLEQSQLMTGIYGTEPPKPLAVVKKEDKPQAKELPTQITSQTETRTVTGRRRIQPVLLSSPTTTSLLFIEPTEESVPITASFPEERPTAAPIIKVFEYPISQDPEDQGLLSVIKTVGQGNLTFEVKEIEFSESEWTVSLRLNDTILWTDYTTVSIIRVEGNQFFIAVLFSDFTMSVYSAFGRCLIHSSVVGQVQYLQVTGGHMFIVHNDHLLIYDLSSQRLLYSLEMRCFSDGVLRASLSQGIIELMLKSGETFVYNDELKMWVKSRFYPSSSISNSDGTYFGELDFGIFQAKTRQDLPQLLTYFGEYTDYLQVSPDPLRKQCLIGELKNLASLEGVESYREQVQMLLEKLSPDDALIS